tara:strand:+ start:1729 stop:3015 length:1287 start_codon:yes stop_codon:yes gene_type:complete
MLKTTAMASGLVLLTSCADWLDDLDPNDWYSTAAGEDAAETSGEVPGESDEYPSLAEVPEKPQNVSSAAEIDLVAESLAADLANAQYTSNIVRADDEVTPVEIPVTSVAAVEEEELTIITAGEEIDIAAAQPIEVPADTLAVTPAVAPEPDAEIMDGATVMAMSTETEVILDEEGELVGSVTRVTETRVTGVDASEADMMVAAAASASASSADDTAGQSLVAMSERDVTDNIVVVPDYMAAADISTSMSVVEEAVTVEALEPAFEDLSFDELFDASSPDATLQTQTVVSAGSPTTVIDDATFTTAGNALVAETLAAIIRFGHGSASLGAKEHEIIAQLAAIHRQTGGPIRLIGHASRTGGGLADADQELVNFEVSLDRAEAVAKALIGNGVPAGDILVEAASASSSMSAAAGIDSEAVDRRVEVFFGV